MTINETIIESERKLEELGEQLDQLLTLIEFMKDSLPPEPLNYDDIDVQRN